MPAPQCGRGPGLAVEQLAATLGPEVTCGGGQFSRDFAAEKSPFSGLNFPLYKRASSGLL